MRGLECVHLRSIESVPFREILLFPIEENIVCRHFSSDMTDETSQEMVLQSPWQLAVTHILHSNILVCVESLQFYQ